MKILSQLCPEAHSLFRQSDAEPPVESPRRAARDVILPAQPGLPNHVLPRFLVPIDFSATSADAVECAVDLARRCDASLLFLHVIDISTQPSRDHHGNARAMMENLWTDALAGISRLACSLNGSGIDANTLVEEGLPWEQIVEKSRGFDLLILSRSRSKPSRIFFPRHTAKRVLEMAACPVLVLEPGQLHILTPPPLRSRLP